MYWIPSMDALTSKTIFLLIAAVLFAPLTGRAQDRADSAGEPTSVPIWVQNFGKQLRTTLESGNPATRDQALQHITYFASFYEEEIDFSDAVPTLVDLYRNDNDANVRLHALVALYAIGDKKGMQQVRQSMHDQRWPPRLKLVTLAALVDYYGAESFSMDREAASYARRLIRYYTPKGDVEIGPLEPMETVDPEEEP